MHERGEVPGFRVVARVDVVRGPVARVHVRRGPGLGLRDFGLERVASRGDRPAHLEHRVRVVARVFGEGVGRSLTRGGVAMVRAGEVEIGVGPARRGIRRGRVDRVGDGHARWGGVVRRPDSLPIHA